MLSGLAYSFISYFIIKSTLREVIADIVTVIGFLLIPEFDTEKFVKRIFVTAIIIFSTIIDIYLIKQYVLNHGHIVLYVLSLLLSIFTLAFYFYIMCAILSSLFCKIKQNTNKLTCGFKYTGAIIGFLISIATLIKMSIEIIDKITGN